MKRWLAIQQEPIDEVTLAKGRSISSGSGAVIYFLGVIRENEGDRNIAWFDYEAFEKMAVHQFGKIFVEVENRWQVESVRLVHRIGLVAVNQPSLWVEVVAPHRAEAFEASH